MSGNEGAGPRGQVSGRSWPPAYGHRLELIRGAVFEVKWGNGNLATCVIDLKASRWRERKEGRNEGRRSSEGFHTWQLIMSFDLLQV